MRGTQVPVNREIRLMVPNRYTLVATIPTAKRWTYAHGGELTMPTQQGRCWAKKRARR